MSEMYGFLLRPKWIAFHVLVFGSIALMIWLGLWQLRRLDERRDFNAVVAERIDQPPVPLDELLATGADPVDLEWRPVTASGTWLPEQVIWFNRSQEGLAGDNVLTALVEGDGTTVVVNRGFVSIAETPSAPPTGDVQVLGRIRVTHERQRGELTDGTDGTPVSEVRRVDLDQLSAQLPGDVAPVFLDLVATVPPITGDDPVPVPVPPLDEGPHMSYAMQWFIFAICVLIGWVLAVRRSIGSHRRAAAGDVTDVPAMPSSETARRHPASSDAGRSSGTPSPR